MNREPLFTASPAAYAYLIPLISSAAFRVGYAIAVHGSMRNDLDLLAAPWTDAAVSAEELLSAIRAGIGFTADDIHTRAHGPEQKPHGRLAWIIPLHGGCAIDLSVMPRHTPTTPVGETERR